MVVMCSKMVSNVLYALPETMFELVADSTSANFTSIVSPSLILAGKSNLFTCVWDTRKMLYLRRLTDYFKVFEVFYIDFVFPYHSRFKNLLLSLSVRNYTVLLKRIAHNLYFYSFGDTK